MAQVVAVLWAPMHMAANYPFADGDIHLRTYQNKKWAQAKQVTLEERTISACRDISDTDNARLFRRECVAAAHRSRLVRIETPQVPPRIDCKQQTAANPDDSFSRRRLSSRKKAEATNEMTTTTTDHSYYPRTRERRDRRSPRRPSSWSPRHPRPTSPSSPLPTTTWTARGTSWWWRPPRKAEGERRTTTGCALTASGTFRAAWCAAGAWVTLR